MKRIVTTMWAVLIAASVLAVLPTAPAQAAGTTANLSWTNPTLYSDGTTALPVADITSWLICWTPPSSGGPKAGCKTVTGSAVTSASVPVACGGENFTVAVTTSATAAVPNATSAPSNVAAYASGITCSPNPPTGLTAS